MDILLDTHILLQKDADRELSVHLQELIEVLSDLNHRLVVHPLSIKEIQEDKNVREKNVLLSRIKSYSKIRTEHDPLDDDAFIQKIGRPENKWDQVDTCLLYCVYKSEVDFFLTEDRDVIKQAAELKISNKVMKVKEALRYFKEQKRKRSGSGTGPVLCFYKKGEHWYVGEKGKEVSFNDMNGFSYIYFLLCNENKLFHSNEIYTAGNISDDNLPRHQIIQEDKDSHGFEPEKPIYEKRLTPSMKQRILDEKEELEEKLQHQSLSENERIEAEDQLTLIKQYLHDRPGQDDTSKVKTVRNNVQKSIKRALNKIHQVKNMSLYLNISTVATGAYCIYRPDINNKPSWILFSE